MPSQPVGLHRVVRQHGRLRRSSEKPRRSGAKSLGEVWACRPVTVYQRSPEGAGKPNSLTASGRIGFTAPQRKSSAGARLGPAGRTVLRGGHVPQSRTGWLGWQDSNRRIRPRRNCLTTSPSVGASPAAETLRAGGACREFDFWQFSSADGAAFGEGLNQVGYIRGPKRGPNSGGILGCHSEASH
jgi:hypothetical protein